jgi:hypothetical protein
MAIPKLKMGPSKPAAQLRKRKHQVDEEPKESPLKRKKSLPMTKMPRPFDPQDAFTRVMDEWMKEFSTLETHALPDFINLLSI